MPEGGVAPWAGHWHPTGNSPTGESICSISLHVRWYNRGVATTYRLDVSLRVVYSASYGVLIGDDLLAHRENLARDPAVGLDHRQLWDFRGVTEVAVSREDLMELLESKSPFGQGSRRAFVAASDVDYGMLKMIQLLRGTCAGEIMVFRDIHGARRWLAVPADTLQE